MIIKDKFRQIAIMYCDKIDEEKKRNLYVAASRAKHKLDIIVNASQEEIDNIAEQISNSNIKNSIAKIATKLKVKPVSILDKE